MILLARGTVRSLEIEAALSEYKGMEKGPVTLGNEIGFGKVYDLLMRYYNQTGEKVFYPSPLLKKRAGIGKGVTLGKASCHYRHQLDDILRSRSSNELGQFGGREKRGWKNITLFDTSEHTTKLPAELPGAF